MCVALLRVFSRGYLLHKEQWSLYHHSVWMKLLKKWEWKQTLKLTHLSQISTKFFVPWRAAMLWTGTILVQMRSMTEYLWETDFLPWMWNTWRNLALPIFSIVLIQVFVSFCAIGHFWLGVSRCGRRECIPHLHVSMKIHQALSIMKTSEIYQGKPSIEKKCGYFPNFPQ